MQKIWKKILCISICITFIPLTAIADIPSYQTTYHHDHTTKKHFYPYLTTRIGKTFQQTFTYKELPIIGDNIPVASFFAKHTTPYATNANASGLGLDIDISKKIRIGASLRNLDLVHAGVKLNPLPDNNNQMHYALLTTAILMQMTYVG